MQLRFLLGPAGSGKTHRCLAGIREALLQSPDGPPLILLAPKQATFQLERQLLSQVDLSGFTRLRISSFERLADFILAELRVARPSALSEEGRVMVLRALLIRHQAELKVFRASARLTGFARELSGVLREFQQHRMRSGRLDQLAARPGTPAQLRDKLHDFSLLLRAYEDWLAARHLQDTQHLLDSAIDALNKTESKFRIEHLWLDGFVEMTPQELDLLVALAPFTKQGTFAFCLSEKPEKEVPWLSQWSVIAETYSKCHARFSGIKDCSIDIKTLSNAARQGRFAANEPLRKLESSWAAPAEPRHYTPHDAYHPIRAVACTDPESEAIYAAREIARFVGNGGRYRDCAVIVRQLESCHATVARVFRRYGIPFFMDRREPVSHHPLTELTRFALRMIAFGWRHDDWFGALKTGLAPATEGEIDWLENLALEHGWEGKVWRGRLTIQDTELAERLEKLRRRLVRPFEELAAALNAKAQGTRGDEAPAPTGKQITVALRQFWDALKIEETLEQWGQAQADMAGNRRSVVHTTVLEQMLSWLDNLALAFPDTSLPLRDWLPILEAGLVNLTVGVIPPALDQVLIGAIDRSRNPELKLALVLGLNEGVFPSPPVPGTLLTDVERLALGDSFSPTPLQHLGQERYLGYIACTRSRERLIVTCAEQDADGQLLNPSPFFEEIGRFAGMGEEKFNGAVSWWESEHPSELAVPLLQAQSLGDEGNLAVTDRPVLALTELPIMAPLALKWKQFRLADRARALAPGIVEQLYGRELVSSVSALEEFAACPFKFFAARGLRLEERKEFQFDARDKGSFQHEILREFHRRVRDTRRQWRDLSAAEAAELIARIGEELLPTYGGGRFLASGAAKFTGRLLIERLKRLLAAIIGWMPQYDFNPEQVEIGFGLEPDHLPSWRLDLSKGRSLKLRGRIDRVDLFRNENGTTLAVVMDYKSRPRALNATKLHHGLELQLLSYLGVLRHLAADDRIFNAKRLVPAGVFYVPLNGGRGGNSATRQEITAATEDSRRMAYQHSGRFLGDELIHFDNRNLPQGDQFKYARNKGGEFRATGNDAMPRKEFDALQGKVEADLRDYGERILAGEVSVAPFRIGQETACERCDFLVLCRFDAWTQPYRQLRPPPKGSK